MTRLIALLALAVIVVGVAGLTVATEQASAQLPPNEGRFDLQCEQTADPTGAGTKGEVTCTLQVDLPDVPQLEDTLSLTIIATYIDVDGSGDPTNGDQLQCIRVLSADGTELANQCRQDGS